MKTKNLFSALLLTSLVIPLASCAVAVESIEASVPDTVYVGDSYELEVIITPSDADILDYTFTSSDSNVLSVDGNTIKGVSVGDVELTLTSADTNIKPVVYDVSVKHRMPTDFNADIPSEMKIGQAVNVTLTYEPIDATYQEFTLNLKDDGILTYNEAENLLTAAKVGDTTVDVKVGELTKTYPVSVKHILPTAIQANIPEEITTVDTIALDVKFAPDNASFKEYSVAISNTDVLAYNPVDKTITPKEIGTSNVTISVPNTEVSKTYTVNVVKGYRAPATEEAYIEFAKTVLPSALANSKDIAINFKQGSAFNDFVTTATAEIRRAENAVSSKVNYTKTNENPVEFKTINTIENNQLIKISENPNDSLFEITPIDDKFTLEDAKAELKLNTLDDILNHLDDNFDNKEIVADIDTDTGDFVVTHTTDVTSYGDKETTVTTLNVTKTGLVKELSYLHKILKEGATSEKTLFDNKYTFTYGAKFENKDLFITDYTPYVATSFDVTYSKGLNVNVGDKFYDSYIKVSNVLPATALNMENYDYKIIDTDKILNDDYRPMFTKAGSVTIEVFPKYYIGEKITKSFTLTATVPEATGFDYVKLDTNDTEYKVGATYNLAAKITPTGADQAYTVTSSAPETAKVSKNDQGVWSVKLLKAGEVTLTFKANSNEMIQKTLKITIVEDKPSAETLPYVGTYDFTIGHFDYTLTLNANDGTIVNKLTSKTEATLTVVDYYGAAKKFIEIQYDVTGSIDMKSTKTRSKFDPQTNTLELAYTTKGGTNKTLILTKNAEKELPAFVGKYQITIGHFDFIITLNEKDGNIVNKTTNTEQGTINIVEYYGGSTIFIAMEFNITGSVDIGAAKRVSKYHPDTSTLDFIYSTKNGIDKTITTTKIA